MGLGFLTRQQRARTVDSAATTASDGAAQLAENGGLSDV